MRLVNEGMGIVELMRSRFSNHFLYLQFQRAMKTITLAEQGTYGAVDLESKLYQEDENPDRPLERIYQLVVQTYVKGQPTDPERYYTFKIYTDTDGTIRSFEPTSNVPVM